MAINDAAPPLSEGTIPFVRTKLSQPRSAARLDGLLDAAAQIVDEHGYASLTTAMVADRAGASIGTLYRYFPDRIALMRALRDRELQRFHDLVVEKVRQSPKIQISDGGDCAIDAFVQMHRHEPGFRIIRFEGPESNPPSDDDYERPGYFARQFVGILSQEFAVDGSQEKVFRMEVVVETCHALVARAFKIDPDGDEKFIEEARVIAREYLDRHFDQNSSA